MTTFTHQVGSPIVKGKFQQIRHVLFGRAVVVRKGQMEGQSTTQYLLSSEANRKKLLEGISELERGEGQLNELR